MTIQEQLQDLVELDSDQYQLSDWEISFVDSVEKQFRSGKEITPKQAAVISKVWDKAFIGRGR
jgi:hypothetical protein